MGRLLRISKALLVFFLSIVSLFMVLVSAHTFLELSHLDIGADDPYHDDAEEVQDEGHLDWFSLVDLLVFLRLD